MSRAPRVIIPLIGALAASALAPALATADVSNVTVGFFRADLPAANPKAGEHVGYNISFKTASGIANGTTVTITAAPGTQLPSNPNSYTFVNDTSTCFATSAYQVILNAVQVTQNSGCTQAANKTMTLWIGRNGGVTDPTTAGAKSLLVETSNEANGASGDYTIYPDVPYTIDLYSGDSQDAVVGNAFTDPISARVTDQYGNPNPGLLVDFALPTDTSQPTGHFPGPASTASDTTNANGVATSPAITADLVPGQWNPTAKLDDGELFTRLFVETNDLRPAPDLTIDSAPAPTSHSATAEVDFHSSDASATFRCKLDTEAEADCASPYIRNSLSEGEHSITVTATDPLANPGTPAVESFIVDAHPPTASIKGPSKTKDRTPTFRFSANESDVTFACKLGSAAFKPCGQAYTARRLKPGKYTLTVRVTDAAGNESTAKQKFKIKR